MIEVQIFAQLTNAFVVIYGGTKYLLSNDDVLFTDGRVYTLPNKLRQRY